jgi:hypothetical protein
MVKKKVTFSIIVEGIEVPREDRTPNTYTMDRLHFEERIRRFNSEFERTVIAPLCYKLESSDLSTK